MTASKLCTLIYGLYKLCKALFAENKATVSTKSSTSCEITTLTIIRYVLSLVYILCEDSHIIVHHSEASIAEYEYKMVQIVHIEST